MVLACVEQQSIASLSFDSKIAIASLIVAMVSLLIALIAIRVGESQLKQARIDSERNLDDWRQAKWFDLYFEADQAYDLLDRFQAKHQSTSSFQWENSKHLWLDDWHDLTFQLRKVNRMAVVFPKSTTIDSLFAATTAFPGPESAYSKERLEQLFDAVNDLRENALLDVAVLVRKSSK